MAEWPSPLKLFLDIENEDDVERRRAESDAEESAPGVSGATGSIAQSVEAPRDRPYSYRPSAQPALDRPGEPTPVSARLIRERLFRSDVVESRPVIQQPLLWSSPVRSTRARLELSPERSQSHMSALETLAQTLYSMSSIQAPVSKDRGPSPLQPLSIERSRPLESAVRVTSPQRQRASAVDDLYSLTGVRRPLLSAVPTEEQNLDAAGITPPVCSFPTSWSTFQPSAQPPSMVSSSTPSVCSLPTGWSTFQPTATIPVMASSLAHPVYDLPTSWSTVQRPVSSPLMASSSTPAVYSLPTSLSTFQRSELPPVMSSGLQHSGRLFGALGM